MALTLDDASLLSDKLVEELSVVGKVKVEDKLSTVSLIGNNIFNNPTISARIFNSIGDMNIRMISYGAGVHNFGLLVDDAFAEVAVKRLHKEFIENDELLDSSDESKTKAREIRC